MFVLGVIVVLGLLLHLFNFWYNMMFAEIVNGGYAYEVTPCCDGYSMIAYTFANPVFTVLYLIWFVALWFHMTHGFWSAIQTLGWNGKIWFARWRMIGIIYVTMLMLIFRSCCALLRFLRRLRGYLLNFKIGSNEVTGIFAWPA